MRYQITLTERQLQVVKEALEVFARLGIGQWRGAFEHLPIRKDQDWTAWHDTLAVIGGLLTAHTLHGIDGYRSSLSIAGDDVHPDAQIAWDIHQVVRHRLAWDRAVADQLIPHHDTSRDWHSMFGVQFDEPMQWGPESLARIEKAPDEAAP